MKITFRLPKFNPLSPIVAVSLSFLFWSAYSESAPNAAKQDDFEKIIERLERDASRERRIEDYDPSIDQVEGAAAEITLDKTLESKISQLATEVDRLANQSRALAAQTARERKNQLNKAQDGSLLHLEMDTTGLSGYEMRSAYIYFDGQAIFDFSLSKNLPLGQRKFSVASLPVRGGQHQLEMRLSFDAKEPSSDRISSIVQWSERSEITVAGNRGEVNFRLIPKIEGAKGSVAVELVSGDQKHAH